MVEYININLLPQVTQNSRKRQLLLLLFSFGNIVDGWLFVLLYKFEQLHQTNCACLQGDFSIIRPNVTLLLTNHHKFHPIMVLTQTTPNFNILSRSPNMSGIRKKDSNVNVIHIATGL